MDTFALVLITCFSALGLFLFVGTAMKTLIPDKYIKKIENFHNEN